MNMSKWFVKEKIMYLRTIAMLQVDPKLRQIYMSSSENLQTKRRVKPCKIGYHQKDKKQNKKNQPRISYISKKIHSLTERRTLQQV
jgi:hypothetical protein